MDNFSQFKSRQIRKLRESISNALETKGFTSIHDLHLQQATLSHTALDNNWKAISKTALYSLTDSEGNPRLDTLLKLCYLLQIDICDLFKEE